ncbi:MAG: SPFH domain-containing protein [Planctomycetaceae bacterium]
MPRDSARDVFLEDQGRKRQVGAVLGLLAALVVFAIAGLWMMYDLFVIDVPAGSMAVLIRKEGKDISNADEVAPDARHKGVQQEVLREGRYFFKYNPYFWKWEVIRQVEIPNGKVGVRVRLFGDDLPYGEFLAHSENQKGIVPGVLQPGRHYIHPYLYAIEQPPLVVVPAGFKGVVTNLAGPIPTEADHYWQDNDDDTHRKLLVKPGHRGVMHDTLDPGTYALNPYELHVSLVDCRNQRFNLSETKDLGFPSKDGFWVSLDSIVEFRVNPETAAKAFVLYNEEANGERIDEEVVRKVILPAARSFCRLQGSNNSGRDFIQGRAQFQNDYQASMRKSCGPLGIDVIQALITKINPPQQIAGPVRDREIAKQKEEQYKQQILQQKSEEKLAIEKELVKQKQALVQAEQEVVRVTTVARREQEVALTKAREKLRVGELKLEATKDEAAAISSRGKAAAEVVEFKNQAEAAGWQRSVEAYDGDGARFAQYVLFQKLSSAYRAIMVNTADSPIMKVFESFNAQNARGAAPAKQVRTANPAPRAGE